MNEDNFFYIRTIAGCCIIDDGCTTVPPTPSGREVVGVEFD